MRLSNDLSEFLELLNSRGVDYVIVGAHSLAFHGRPRYTGDLEILVRATTENAGKLVALLNQCGFVDSGFKESDFTEPEQMIQLGRPPNRIDLLTSISCVTTPLAVAWLLSSTEFLFSCSAKIALIRNKRAVGRAQDLADLETLES